MPSFEYEFSNQDRQLVVNQQSGNFSGTDYIRLTIYPTEAINNIVTLPDTDKQAIFYSSLSNTEFDINISPFGIGTDIFDTYTIGGVAGENDFRIYKNGDSVYIKPNEIFNEFELPQGDYKIQIDFLNQLNPPIQSQTADTDEQEDDSDQDIQIQQSFYQFIIKQVSTSRKEVRLKLLDKDITNNSSEINNITNQLNNNASEFLDDNVTPNPDYKYQFKHILNIGTGDHNPIMNYQFDAVTDGKDNQSIILKLYDSLPTNVGNLSMVTIEKEVLITQTEDIYYFSDVPDVFFGDGLIPDEQENWINPDGNDINFQNYDEISGSIDDITLDNLISSSDNYPNLNTDFRFFKNHTFFGSAKKKIVNFKNKVETIQGHYSDISKSLYSDGVAIGGDSTSVTQTRKNLFKKINNEIKTFTPYERFLYYDGQSESTASAPGIGKNYANSIPVTSDVNEYEGLNGHDGFNVVYKHSNKNMTTGQFVDVFTNSYHAHKKPFFNYSSSIYLSFVLKGNDTLKGDGTAGLFWQNSNSLPSNNGLGLELPTKAFGGATKLQNPSITGSEYRRHIYVTSQSYWIPTTGETISDIDSIGDWSSTSTQYEIISGSVKTGSNKIVDSTGLYPTTVVSSSAGIPFKGSVMPAGELFRIFFDSGSAITSSFISDVKISLKNPSDTLPFDNIYLTTSTNWTTWYNTMISNAETFDTNNIHSLENNLPLYIKESNDYGDMKDFLSLQGEQYDVIRNHIDSLGTLHNRGYKKTNSPPDNTLPMLLNNMGWEAINPFSGSLTDSLGSYLTGITSIDDIKNNTWRKTLNNLLYIYKSKGTKNSVRGLLNTYGYPPDVLQFQEFGGTTENQNDNVLITDNIPNLTGTTDLDLSTSTGSIGFTTNKQKLYRYIVGNKYNRILNLDWWMNGANANTFEFVYKHKHTTNTQTILKSSGSGNESLWDLRLVPSTLGESSSFQFRLNNSQIADTAIGSRGFSMSLAYNKITDGQLWNVMIQRMTGSARGVGQGTNEYRLHSSLQEREKIKTYSYVTMSISGGITADSTLGGKGHFANVNFNSSGSRGTDVISSSGLYVGETVSGSLSQIKAWTTPLSISRFRQHTLNKFSTTGNSIESHCKELIYHFKLNENYSSSSISASAQSMTIIDSAPKINFLNHSFQKPGYVFNSSSIYGFDYIDVVKLSIQDNSLNQNDNNILINPPQTIVGNLNPNQSAIESLTNRLGKKPKIITSQKLELYRSPQNFVNNYILNNIDGFNLEKYYGNPQYKFSSSYTELDTLREDFFNCHPITVDTNKFIKSHENMFNQSIVDGIKSIVPARSTYSGKNSNVGVEIKPTILEKQKYEHERHSVETNPNTATGSLVAISVETITTGSFVDLPKSGSISVVSIEAITTGSFVDLPKSGSITTTPSTTGSFIDLPKSGSITTKPSTIGSSVVFPKSGSIDYASHANKSFVNIHDSWGTSDSSGSDTHFINYAGGTGSRGNYNVGHIDTRFHFISIGDTEIYSGSNGNLSDFSDASRLYNREMVSTGVHADITYNSLINGNPGGRTGRMMGKTRYFSASADGGTLTIPSNHYSKFSYPFKEQMYDGAQNTNPGILNVQYEDYSTASFYRVKVTGGENQITVKTPNTKVDSDNKIIY